MTHGSQRAALLGALALGTMLAVTASSDAHAKDPGRLEAKQYRNKKPPKLTIYKRVGDFPGGRSYNRIGLWDRRVGLGGGGGYRYVPPPFRR